ncbi:MAG: ABC transporter substrate-binding protein [Bacillota bacterium]
MKKFKFLFLALSLLLVLGLAAAGCSQGEGDTDPEETKVLVMAYDRDAETLDHIRTSWYSDALIYIFDRLVSRDYDFNYQPGLAERWETSEDGLTWTFYLREGVKFHDGKDLTAEDVKWTLDTILDPDTASPFSGDLQAIQEVVVKGDLELDIILKHPFPNLLFNLSNTAAGIAPKDAYTEHGDSWGITTVIGTGPYMLEEWVQGDRIVLKKNPDYNWGPEWMSNRGPALIDEVVLRTIPEETARLMELETGGVHIIRNIPPTVYDKVKDNADITVIQGSATRLGYLAYACDLEPFTDVRVRQAINHAIDRDSIVEFVFRGLAEPAYGYLPPALKSEYYAGSEADGYKYDPDRAKELLAEAGFADGFSVTLSADNSTESTRLAEVFQSQLKEVGITAEINLMDSASYVDFLKEGKQELFIRLYSWPNADILDWFLLSSQFPYPNHSHWVDDTTDELITAAAQMATWDERAAGYQAVQKHLIEQAVWCPVYVPDTLIAVRKEVKNFKFHPWQMMLNDGFDLE